eukprot:m.174627 g.174627  ORF g.174627 m.174627 type:complete len:792 (+) comp31775_c0_seq1:209-2584(+)
MSHAHTRVFITSMARILLSMMFSSLLATSSVATGVYDVSKHNVTWTGLLPEPGKNKNNQSTYHNSMPIGNGHLAANVIYETATDSLVFMISASSSWAETGEPLKVALLNVKLPSRGGQTLGSTFTQTFNPQDSTVRFAIPASATSPALNVVTYVDANSDSIVVSVSPPRADVIATLTPLRTYAHMTTPSQDCQSYNQSADVLTPNGLLVYHRNALAPADTYMVKAFAHMNIPLVPDFIDPLMNRSTGVMLAKVETTADTSTTFAATLLTAQTNTAEAYETAIASASATFVATQRAGMFPPEQHLAWWAGKWASHSIEVGGSDVNTAVISQMYVLQRWIQLSQTRSPYPIKFNGMLYGATRPPSQDENGWGGLNWWQNLRHPYYNMLTAGDADSLRSMLQSFNYSVPVARVRTRAYFGFDGIFWGEGTQVFYGSEHPGGPVPELGYAALKGCVRQFPDAPIWHPDDRWNGYNRQGSLDLSLMVLDHWAYTGEVDPDLLAIPMGVVEFYVNLWGNTSTSNATNGTMVFHPTQALETWQCPGWPVNESDCPTNDMPTVAGLHAVLEKIVRLPTSVASVEQIAQWMLFKTRLPPLPTINGTFAACDDCVVGGSGRGSHRTTNAENAELYCVHPYRLTTVARGDPVVLAKARATFAARRFQTDRGWNQNIMDAALLGNATAAAPLLIERAQTPPALGFRFPAFAPHEQDWEPSADHFAIFANALQYMLIQRVDDVNDSVMLLPAWPCEWDVNFIVSAPRNTTINGSVSSGALSFTVTPSARTASVLVAPCQPITTM